MIVTCEIAGEKILGDKMLESLSLSFGPLRPLSVVAVAAVFLNAATVWPTERRDVQARRRYRF